MPFEGYVDFASTEEIRGWVYESRTPDTALQVEIWAADKLIARIKADQYRQDLQNAGKGNGKHAFHFRRPASEGNSAELCARVAGEPWFLRMSGGPNQGIPRWHQQFQHTMEYGLPTVPYGFTETPPRRPKDSELAERLIRAWHSSHAADPDPKRESDMWTENAKIFHGSFEDSLRRRDARALADYLSELYARPITHGIIQGEQATIGLSNPDGASFVAAIFMDYLVSLAEALGVLPVECAEQHGHYGKNLFADPDDLVDRISTAAGTSIIPPVVAGKMFGIRTHRGIVHTRDLCAIWAALRLSALTSGSICEIGGGVGNVAYFAWKLGNRNYTIIDLPNINVLQGYCIIRALPDVPVILQGEEDPGGPAIRILPTWRFGLQTRYELVFNQDSFPEMHPSISIGYLTKAREVADGLLSMNQEAEGPQLGGSQTIVKDLVRKSGGYERVYRFPHWLRRGYVEEFYIPADDVKAERTGILRRLLRRS